MYPNQMAMAPGRALCHPAFQQAVFFQPRCPVIPAPVHRHGAPQAGIFFGLMNVAPALKTPAAGGVFSANAAMPNAAKLMNGVQRRPAPIPPLPISLEQYLGLKGFSPEFNEYGTTLKKYIYENDLTRHSNAQTYSREIGHGSSKTCYEIRGGRVLLVHRGTDVQLTQELVLLKVLKNAGFPVVRTLEAGKISYGPSNGSGPVTDDFALIQERLHEFYTFERATKKMRRDILNSPRLNQNTLASLQTIRHLVKTHGVEIRDLQGGLRDDGAFVIADPLALTKSDPDHFMHFVHQKTMRKLDKLIMAVEARLKN